MSLAPKLLALILLAASLTVAGCAAETARTAPAAKPPVEYCRPAVALPEVSAKSGRNAEVPAVVAEAGSARAATAVRGEEPPPSGAASPAPLDRLFFDFDSYVLTPSARSTLDLVYDKLGASDRSYTLEGYCDERGDDEYNLALGERRAAAARAYLVTRGVAGERLRTISYGRDFPADPERNEEAYQRNRRVEVVDAQAPGPESRYGVGK